MAVGALQPLQIWAILSRHAQQDIAHLRLQELCRDNDRVSALVSVYNTVYETSPSTPQEPVTTEHPLLIADLSRQRWTLETVNHLLCLAAATNLRKFIQQLAWGQNNPNDPVLPINLQQQQQQKEETGPFGAKKSARFQNDSSIRPKPSIVDTSNAGPAASTQQQDGSSCPSLHMALRVPKEQGHAMYLRDGTDALESIHATWDRIERFAGALRLGHLRGVTGAMFRNVIVVGRGVPMAALQFLNQALQHDERAVFASRVGLAEGTTTRLRRMATNQPSSSGRNLRVLSRIDPVAAARVMQDLDPAATLVISWALQGNEETGLATKLLKSWLLQELGSNRRSDVVLSKHMLLVTGNDHVASIINKPESVFLVPEHARCEAFTSFTAATLLPLSIVYGWPIAKEFLAGAHNMDNHFVDTNPRHNIPVLLALSDIWNDVFLNASARVVVPYTQAFQSYPTFCGALEAQTCGNTTTRSSGQPNVSRNPTCSPFVVDGGLDSIYDRAFYQSDKVMSEELITALDTQLPFHLQKLLGLTEGVQGTQDALMASVFAHADELAFGYDRILSDPVLPSPMSVASVQTISPEAEVSRGNRPSTLLIVGKLDAFACGQLIALAEHRAIVKAHIWGIDPFCIDLGTSLRMQRTDHLKDDLETLFTTDIDSDDEDSGMIQNHNMNLSTRTILKHYAQMMRGLRKSDNAKP